ncbi:hypothetical protein [Bradyrhizobium japonicum]|uniref:hypothetical protein n=1 Tax=Bradyrhizobium japonicum TaxID=375 RepID=UPI00271522B5|nr:hypothetical protein [Bradyrhizobium japonicum]WLB57899.1 hypothetical protein QIH94_18480 [Bradyrhizobium japonicum]WLB60235.1 hypothetical protein QIH96_27465 [Bradyrhizobium japonicum]
MNVYLAISLLISQLVFYGAIFGLMWAAYLVFRWRLYASALLTATVGFPALSYLYHFIDGALVAPAVRKAEVTSWRRVSITSDNKPRVFIDTWGTSGYVPKALLALGRFEKAYGRIGDEWYYFERTPGTVCAENHYDVSMLNRMRQPVPCVSATKTGQRAGFRELNIPRIAEPRLLLFADRDAPSHYQSDTTNTLELRLVSDQANQLVSFWEIPYFGVPMFPPNLNLDGWFKVSAATDYTRRPEEVKFVIDALNGT